MRGPSIVVSHAADGGGMVQRIDYAGFFSGDSWVGWGNAWKEGAKEKWDLLRELYREAYALVVKNQPVKPVDAQKQWAENELVALNDKPIGFSQFEAARDRLYAVLQRAHPSWQRDVAAQQANKTHQDQVIQALGAYRGQVCPLIQSPQTTFAGPQDARELIKALLCKLSAGGFSKTVCDKLKTSLEQQKKYVEFKPGKQSLASYGDPQSTVELDFADRDYASDAGGKIVLNDIEIVTVHELGHLLGNLGVDRGTPQTAYDQLSSDDRALWSDQEEYLNISQVENPYRDEKKVPRRRGHAGDPLIHAAHLVARSLVTGAEEWNALLVLHKHHKKNDLRLTAKEQTELGMMIPLFKKGDGRSKEETATLRWLLRRNVAKLNQIRSLQADKAWGRYEQQVQDAEALVKGDPGLGKGLLPTSW